MKRHPADILLQNLMLFALLLLSTSAARAQNPGDLDSTFGNAGIVVTPITDGANLYEEPTSMLVQPDGKIVVCGMVEYSDEETGYPVSFFLARYNPAGTLDASFGTDGKVIAPFGGSSGGVYTGQSIALQGDGKIIAVGYWFGRSSAFAVNRYNPDGTVDISFGTGGTVITPNVIGGAYDVAVQPDDKIIVIGSAYVRGQDNNFAVVRYNPNGSLDASFGTNGSVTTAVGNGEIVDEAYAVALQPDGKILVVGTSFIIGGISGEDLALVRYQPNGSLDAGFGANGKIIHSLTNEHEIASDVAVQPDGKIVVVGDNRYGVGPSAIVRYNGDGSLDTDFAANGIFSTPRDFFSGRHLALQPDGKIVLFGSGRVAEDAPDAFAVARLNQNGVPDASFGLNGRLLTSISPNVGSGAFAGALQSDGKLLAFGGVNNEDIALIRYLGGSGVSACANPNSTDCPAFFVRQHYRDFLNRDPDSSGLAFWINEMSSCGNDVACREVKRINISAAFFLSIEFQETGYLVYRLHKTSRANLPGTPIPVRYDEFLRDAQQIGRGVIVNQPDWRTVLANNKQAFANEFVQRSQFTSAYPDYSAPAEFVDALFANAGVTPTEAERGAAISEFGSAPTISDAAARARALLRVAEDPQLVRLEFNRAFVLMQYFGYLRRNPNDAPDGNFDGYNFWLDKLSSFNGDFIGAEMVKAFLSSSEYRQRFGL